MKIEIKYVIFWGENDPIVGSNRSNEQFFMKCFENLIRLLDKNNKTIHLYHTVLPEGVKAQNLIL